MGAYTVFLDVALGFGSPALGLLGVDRSGLGVSRQCNLRARRGSGRWMAAARRAQKFKTDRRSS